MKTYKDYTDDELMALDDDQLDMLIDLQCAINGVPLLPIEPEPVNIDLPPTDAQVYEVAGFYFKERESADRIMEAINKEVRVDVTYDWQLSDRTEYIQGYASTGANITAKDVYSNDLYDETKAKRAKLKAMKDLYDKQRGDFDSIKSQREESASEVFRSVYKAREERENKIIAHQRYDRYVKLANGDANLANKFFADAYPNDTHYILDPIEDQEAS